MKHTALYASAMLLFSYMEITLTVKYFKFMERFYHAPWPYYCYKPQRDRSNIDYDNRSVLTTR